MDDHLCVGFRRQFMAGLNQFSAQFTKVLDNAIVDNGDARGRMRMGVDLVRDAMRCPAGMANAGGA